MRVLVLESQELGSTETIEIKDIGYDDDITEVKDEDGNYDKYNNTPVTGIYMRDLDDDYMYIKGVSLAECNTVTLELMKTGYADLSAYGVCEVLDL